VALGPGYSLMDWIRLGSSGADLTSVGGELKSVTEEELKLHNLNGNAWLVIRGQFSYHLIIFIKEINKFSVLANWVETQNTMKHKN